MKYNTQERKLAMPEYGRSIQHMIDYALTIEDKAERQRCAKTIVKIMGNMYPLQRELPDFKRKLWDHLAIMSDFKLDIDYPYEVVKPDTLVSVPKRIPYSTGRIRYRHYGAVLELLIKKAVDYPEGEEKKQLIHAIAVLMHKNYVAWNKDTVETRKIITDLEEYTEGKIRLSESDFSFINSEPRSTQRSRALFVQQRRRSSKKK